MDWNFQSLIEPMNLTEGPAWDGSGLLFSNIPNSCIMRYDPQTEKVSVYRTSTNEANGLMFDKDGRLYACESGAAHRALRSGRLDHRHLRPLRGPSLQQPQRPRHRQPRPHLVYRPALRRLATTWS